MGMFWLYMIYHQVTVLYMMDMVHNYHLLIVSSLGDKLLIHIQDRHFLIFHIAHNSYITHLILDITQNYRLFNNFSYLVKFIIQADIVDNLPHKLENGSSYIKYHNILLHI